MNNKTRTSLALLLVFALALSGCWSRREMESLAYILVWASMRENGGVTIHAQVGTPPSQKRAAAQEEPAFNTLTTEGRNVTEAVANLF